MSISITIDLQVGVKASSKEEQRKRLRLVKGGKANSESAKENDMIAKDKRN